MTQHYAISLYHVVSVHHSIPLCFVHTLDPSRIHSNSLPRQLLLALYNLPRSNIGTFLTTGPFKQHKETFIFLLLRINQLRTIVYNMNFVDISGSWPSVSVRNVVIVTNDSRWVRRIGRNSARVVYGVASVIRNESLHSCGIATI